MGSIDGLRAIAVLSVLCFHIFHWTLGARGVDLFFVISGACLGWGALKNGLDLRKFAWARVRRIVPPFYAAVAVGVLIAVGDGRLTLSHALAEGARNLVFWSENPNFPTIRGMFWTILLEARWYVYFPLLLWAYKRARGAFWAVLGVCIAGNLFSVPWMDREALPAFMLGIVAAENIMRGRVVPNVSGIAIVLLAGAIVQELLHPVASTLGEHGNFLWQIALFFIVLAGQICWSPVLTWKPLRFLGRASYSIYLAQGSAMELLGRFHLFPLLEFAGVLGFCLAFWFIFERPFMRSNHGTAENKAQYPVSLPLRRMQHI